jgi:hypothetical protein
VLSPTIVAKKNLTQGAAARDEIVAAAKANQAPPDPLAALSLKKLGPRLGLPLIGLWMFALWLNVGWVFAVVGVVTIALAGVIFWAYRFATRSRKVADIVRSADTKEARKEALEKLGTDFKKSDTAAIFAKAQLEMQDDPRRAQKTLEEVNLSKVMAPMADEARAQRAMIHLMYGETDEARALVDDIDMTRHKEARSRAMMAAVVGEAWARTGQSKKAVELLETFDPQDSTYSELKPQLLRARAFAYAWANDTKHMKATLRMLNGINGQFLMGFITKKKNPGGVPSRGVHPMLEKEAYDMVVRSGAVPRRVEMRR